MKRGKSVVVILHNIRSAYNVGSIFRTAEAVGVDKVYLTGYSPAPLDRFGNARKDIAKTALGAQDNLAWEHKSNISDLLNKLSKEEYELMAVEQSEKALDYRKTRAEGRIAFMFGNEVRGLSSTVLSRSDNVIEIPMKGKKESLNVSVTVGIILFSLLK